jgi:hypothetical protein
LDYRIIRNARRHDPFRPFLLKAKDGRRFPVREPEHVLVTHWLLVVVNEADSLSHVDPADIESLIYADEQQEQRPNGHCSHS